MSLAWIARLSDFDTGQGYRVCYAPGLGANGRFVAVGYGGSAIVTSDNGGTIWTSRASDLDGGQGNDVVWSPELDLFVAVGYDGSDGAILTSPDGINWTNQGQPFESGFAGAGVAWSASQALFVAVGGSSGAGTAIFTSPDGAAWSASPSPYDVVSNLNGVCWVEELGLWVVGATGGVVGGPPESIATSPDTSTWTPVASDFDGSICYLPVWLPDAAKLLVLGQDSGASITVLESADGSSFAPLVNPLDGGFAYGAVEAGPALIVVGQSSDSTVTIIASPDAGASWESDTTPFDNANAAGVTYASLLGVAIAVGGFTGDPGTAAIASAIVSTPTPPVAPPTQVFGGTRFYEAPTWRIIVGDLEDNTLTFLDRLALDRSVTVTRAAARVIGGRVPSDNPEVNIPAPDPDGEPFLSEGTRIVSCFRREAPGSGDPPWVIRARGLILSLTDDADSDHATSTFTGYDPWKYLYRRPVLVSYSDPPTQDVSYPAGTSADEIIIDQLQIALDADGTIFTDFGQTAYYAGTIESTDPLPDDGDGLAMTFRAGTTLGEMLDLLVATGTCDVVFDPIYDIANRPGLLCEMSIYQSAGSFKPNAVMGWDRWPRSLVGLSRQVEGTERANKVQMYAGQGGPPVPEEDDSASIARFGAYWMLQYLPGVPSLAGAHTIAQRQLALLKDGQYTYALSPSSERAPLLFEEYREADTVPVYADQRFRDPISGVPVRVESIPIVIGDDQLERVNQMLVSFAPEAE